MVTHGHDGGIDGFISSYRYMPEQNWGYVALLNSTNLDTDADGIVNAYDLSPFDGVALRSAVTFTNVPPLSARITWEAAALTDYRIEFTPTIAPPNWQFLMTFTNTIATNGPVTAVDPVPTDGSGRFYRVLYSP